MSSQTEANVLIALIGGFLLLVIAHLYLRDRPPAEPREPPRNSQMLTRPATRPQYEQYVPPPLMPEQVPPPVQANPAGPPQYLVPVPPPSAPLGVGPLGQQQSSAKLYEVIFQRLNPITTQWEDEVPSLPLHLLYQNPFTVYHRRQQIAFQPTLTYIKVQCNGLKTVLRKCIRYEESIFDSVPFVISFQTSLIIG